MPAQTRATRASKLEATSTRAQPAAGTQKHLLLDAAAQLLCVPLPQQVSRLCLCKQALSALQVAYHLVAMRQISSAHCLLTFIAVTIAFACSHLVLCKQLVKWYPGSIPLLQKLCTDDICIPTVYPVGPGTWSPAFCIPAADSGMSHRWEAQDCRASIAATTVESCNGIPGHPLEVPQPKMNFHLKQVFF